MEDGNEEKENKFSPVNEDNSCANSSSNATANVECLEPSDQVTLNSGESIQVSFCKRDNLSEKSNEVKEETDTEVTSRSLSPIHIEKPDHEVLSNLEEKKNFECTITSESSEVITTVNEACGLEEDMESTAPQIVPPQPSHSIDNTKRNDSLALISSLYDSSDSGSESQSLADEFSEHRSECFSSNSENSDSDDSEESDSDLESIIAKKPSFIPKQIKVKGELNIKDLPPIEDLHISVKEEECIPFGKVYSIVDTLLVIQSLPDKPALNLDSIFFRHNGVPVGRIFDVFGPVKRPFYSVRFNSNKEIHDKGLQVDVVLYAAPETKHTQYVFAQQLMKEKGSDASWVNDCEPPVECIDYSDDEEERNNLKKQKKVTIKQEEVEDGSPARKRYLTFEERMNRNNMMRNKYYSKMQNPSPHKRTWDVGWHNRIDRPLSSPSAQPLSPNISNGVFHMRPPLFVPPPSASGPLSIRSPLPNEFPLNNQHPSLPPFNPHHPPPGWPNSPSQRFHPTSNHTFPTSRNIVPPVCPALPPNMTRRSPDAYFQCPPIGPQQSFMRPQFSSSSSTTSDNYFQFPQFSSGGNSF